jgi:hypothetical protein
MNALRETPPSAERERREKAIQSEIVENLKAKRMVLEAQKKVREAIEKEARVLSASSNKLRLSE